MRVLRKISKEAQLNQLIKTHRSNDFVILFHSIWDDKCKKIMSHAERWAEQEGDEEVHAVSSWDVPHGFMAFSVTATPCLVTRRRGRIRVDYFYPNLYRFFQVKDAVGN